MNDTAISWHRRLYDRLRGWGGLMLGLIIGAVAFGASTAGAGPSLQDPAMRQQGIEEECAEGCDFEENKEHFWGEGLGEYILKRIFEAPPAPTDQITAKP
jgi:hypothetical protein